MELHTKRVVEIFKQVLKDRDELKEKGVRVGDVVAYTSKVSTPNIVEHDVRMMIKELEYGNREHS